MTELSAQSDAFLIGSIVNGDAEAIRPLIERYQRPLFAFLHRTLAVPSEVEDVAQETWIRVVRSARRYDPEQPFARWLFAIAWNLVRDRWAKARRYDATELDSLSSSAQSAEDVVIARDRLRRVHELVRALPEQLAQTIFLRYFEELSEREIATRLGVPVGTVKSRIHYGLAHLAAAWSEEKETWTAKKPLVS